MKYMILLYGSQQDYDVLVGRPSGKPAMSAEAVAAMQEFRRKGGRVIFVTNAPRPRASCAPWAAARGSTSRWTGQTGATASLSGAGKPGRARPTTMDIVKSMVQQVEDGMDDANRCRDQRSQPVRALVANRGLR